MYLTKLKWCIKINSNGYCNRILDKKKFIQRLNRGGKMNNETYIVSGMIFGFLALWLFFSLAKKLSNSSRFPKQKKNQKIDQKFFLPTLGGDRVKQKF